MKKFGEFNINEGRSRTYDVFLEEIIDDLKRRSLTDIQSDQYINYWHGKGYLYDLWQNGYPVDQAIDSLKDGNTITWFK